MNEECNWIVDIDLEKFFDTVNHDKLISILNKEIKDGKDTVIDSKASGKRVMVGTQVKRKQRWAPRREEISLPYLQILC